MSPKIFDIGAIRPPSEMTSLLLRITENCTWNKCNFCTLYQNQKFKMRNINDIKKDIDNMFYYKELIFSRIEENKFNIEKAKSDFDNLSEIEKECYTMIYSWIFEGKMKSLFLQDANSIIVKSDILSDIIIYIKNKFPEIEKITTYGRADTLSNIKIEDYMKLKNAGLTRIHSGFESSSDNVLKLINKGTTQLQQIDCGLKIKEANIEFSIYFMPGCGGRKFSYENAIETAKVINKIEPNFIRLRTFVVKYNSYMENLVKQNKFVECTDIEKLKEIKLLIENIDNCNSYIISDHIINLLKNIEGNLKIDKNSIISYIDEFLNLNEHKQKIFQILRRSGYNDDYKNINKIPSTVINNVKDYIDKIYNNKHNFEDVLKNYLNNYI